MGGCGRYVEINVHGSVENGKSRRRKRVLMCYHVRDVSR